MPPERGLSSFSSSDRHRPIRRASGASMAASCFPARRESSILQPAQDDVSRHREGKTHRRREGTLRRRPPQERRPQYRRYMSRWPSGQTMSWSCPSFAPRHPGARRVFRPVVWQAWKFPLSCYTCFVRRPFQRRLSTDLALFRDFHAPALERSQVSSGSRDLLRESGCPFTAGK